jgi:hypothetical protein
MGQVMVWSTVEEAIWANIGLFGLAMVNGWDEEAEAWMGG